MQKLESNWNYNELEFIIFCIENLAKRLKVDATKIYDILNKNKIISDYIVPSYDVLHTQSKDYILDDLTDILDEKGIKIWKHIQYYYKKNIQE